MRRLRAAAQILLGAAMVGAGTGHLTFQREEFQAQVPPWVPIDEDLTVLLSGAVEIGLGAALLVTWKQPRRALAGAALAAFYVAIFPGNIAQYTEHRDAFGLDTDTKRLARLFFQPLLIAWALAATDAPRVWRESRQA
ncbi:hypothetical protein OJ962_04005 [Solirubrobacter sp. CPCC 204708]|uniref:DoxX family membrane protein n=2 Tax=Solirubrobacter deserti TaxID=2282478 RepID=A0ABT4RDQ6_9ACTN|nr:hypothetical protein [Solirubrobacter deserti]MDA0136648.1 hypothetical protein [Solirubrobacter deserti]